MYFNFALSWRSGLANAHHVSAVGSMNVCEKKILHLENALKILHLYRGVLVWTGNHRERVPSLADRRTSTYMTEVCIQPGSTHFTRARPPSLTASARVRPISPALEAAYASLQSLTPVPISA